MLFTLALLMQTMIRPNQIWRSPDSLPALTCIVLNEQRLDGTVYKEYSNPSPGALHPVNQECSVDESLVP